LPSHPQPAELQDANYSIKKLQLHHGQKMPAKSLKQATSSENLLGHVGGYDIAHSSDYGLRHRFAAYDTRLPVHYDAAEKLFHDTLGVELRLFS
jgi:hypothetical protein